MSFLSIIYLLPPYIPQWDQNLGKHKKQPHLCERVMSSEEGKKKGEKKRKKIRETSF